MRVLLKVTEMRFQPTAGFQTASERPSKEKERNYLLVKKWHCQVLTVFPFMATYAPVPVFLNNIRVHTGLFQSTGNILFLGGWGSCMGIHNYSLNFMHSSVGTSHNKTKWIGTCASFPLCSLVTLPCSAIADTHLGDNTKTGEQTSGGCCPRLPRRLCVVRICMQESLEQEPS